MKETKNFPANTPYTVAELGGMRHGIGGEEYPNIVAALASINADARHGVSALAGAAQSEHLIAGNLAVLAHINRVVSVFLNNPAAAISENDACTVLNVVLEIDSVGEPTVTTLVVAPTVMFEAFADKIFGSASEEID